MDEDSTFNMFVQTVIALLVLGAVMWFVFEAGGWYTQARIVEVRCNTLEMK